MNFHGKKNGGAGLLALVLLLACGLLLGGCESDSVAPNDDLPQVTEQEAAQQAALVAAGVSRVGPALVNFDGSKSLEDEPGFYTYTFPSGGDVSGSIHLQYYSGGPSGVPSMWDDADYGRLFTPVGSLLVISLDLGGGVVPTVGLGFQIQGDIDRDTDSAVVNGVGNFVSGDMMAGFSFSDLLVSGLSSYPSGGTMGFTSGTLELTVIFDGDHTANVEIGEVVSYVIDLDTGEVAAAE